MPVELQDRFDISSVQPNRCFHNCPSAICLYSTQADQPELSVMFTNSEFRIAQPSISMLLNLAISTPSSLYIGPLTKANISVTVVRSSAVEVTESKILKCALTSINSPSTRCLMAIAPMT